MVLGKSIKYKIKISTNNEYVFIKNGVYIEIRHLIMDELFRKIRLNLTFN